ncbi:site-specific integrase [Parabacteroides segnis]|uniref:tyrosine-type recombinase/integrase n=1 Tax=Parabacteroides segnis TaxID=2763058 RepID=UPI003510DA72
MQTRTSVGTHAKKALFTKLVENAKIVLILDPRSKLEETHVTVRVTYNRKSFYYRTGLQCDLEMWDKLHAAKGTSKANMIKKGQEDIFDKVVSRVTELFLREQFSFDRLKQVLKGRNQETFSYLWESIINNLRKEGRAGTADSYNNAYNCFSKSIGANIPYTQIGVETVEKWTEKMEEAGLSQATIGIYHRGMRVAINRAIADGNIKPSQYPFGKATNKISIKKGRSRTEAYLPVTDILKLKNYDTPEKREIYQTKWICEAVNMFLFSYLANGMNLMDICLLTYNNHYFNSKGKELMFVRKKTEATSESEIQIIVPIIPELQKILDYYASTPSKDCYVFPDLLKGETDPIKIKAIVKDLNADFGFRLKKAAKEVEISKPISMTYARHSYATNLTHAGVSERYISQAMGHSNKNVTGGYIAPFSPQKRVSFNSMLLISE